MQEPPPAAAGTVEPPRRGQRGVFQGEHEGRQGKEVSDSVDAPVLRPGRAKAEGSDGAKEGQYRQDDVPRHETRGGGGIVILYGHGLYRPPPCSNRRRSPVPADLSRSGKKSGRGCVLWWISVVAWLSPLWPLRPSRSSRSFAPLVLFENCLNRRAPGSSMKLERRHPDTAGNHAQ